MDRERPTRGASSDSSDQRGRPRPELARGRSRTQRASVMPRRAAALRVLGACIMLSLGAAEPSAARTDHVQHTMRVGEPVGTVNPTYASWNVDGSWNRGFFNVDWKNKNLRAAAASLQPSTLRFGGGGNDFIKCKPCDRARPHG